jgi:3'(2'), 5'-bisphosphate nucleotidase
VVGERMVGARVVVGQTGPVDVDQAQLAGTRRESDAALASRLAVEAGRILVNVRDTLTAEGAYPWQIMDTGDVTSHRFLMQALHEARPDDIVLSEEGVEDSRRYAADRVWIVDPLDGTNEFGERGRADWAVHVALWERGALTAGAVSLPVMDLVFATDPAPVVPPVSRDRPRLVTSRTRNPYSAVVVANALGADAVRLGSAGAKAMAVVVGEADIYVHDGGMYQWDSAAPAAVAVAAGLHVSRIDGSPMVYNERDPWLPDFLVCRPELADDVLAALRPHTR